MIDPQNIPPVADCELLARFILQSNEFREDGSVKPALFLPYARIELSVNRHRDASDTETWQVGHKVASDRQKNFMAVQTFALVLVGLYR